MISKSPIMANIKKRLFCDNRKTETWWDVVVTFPITTAHPFPWQIISVTFGRGEELRRDPVLIKIILLYGVLYGKYHPPTPTNDPKKRTVGLLLGLTWWRYFWLLMYVPARYDLVDSIRRTELDSSTPYISQSSVRCMILCTVPWCVGIYISSK